MGNANAYLLHYSKSEPAMQACLVLHCSTSKTGLQTIPPVPALQGAGENRNAKCEKNKTHMNMLW